MVQYIRPLSLERLTEEGQQSDPLSITVAVHCLWCWRQTHYTSQTHVTSCFRRSGGLWENWLVKVYKLLCTIWPGHNLHNIIILQPFILRKFHAESIVNIFHTSPMSSSKCNEICFQQRKCSHCFWETSQTRERILQDAQQRHGHLEPNYSLYSSLNSLCM